MSLTDRIERLERQAGAEPWRPWVYVQQDQGDPDLWHVAGGEDYRQAELDQLGQYRLILVWHHGGEK